MTVQNKQRVTFLCLIAENVRPIEIYRRVEVVLFGDDSSGNVTSVLSETVILYYTKN